MSISSASPRVSEGQYLFDILDQGDALTRTLASLGRAGVEPEISALATLQPSSPLVLTGMGSSFYALIPFSIRLAEMGLRPLLIETSELIHYWPNLLRSDCTVVAVSQSGRSAEMLRLLELNRNGSKIIGVTNDAGSPLAQQSAFALQLDAGPEATVSCKTYTSTLLALSYLGEVVAHSDLEEWQDKVAFLSGQVKSYLQDWRDHVDELLRILAETERMVLLGRGDSLASAGTGGLIIKEAAHFHAEGMSSAAFRHGPLEMTDARLFALIFEGDARSAGLNRGLAQRIAALGGTVALVSPQAPQGTFRIPVAKSAALRPVFEALPVQMITLALAARASRVAGAFTKISKVTSTE